ncbi:MAG: helix-turn-helix domain-containing protein [Cyclobacteriaceae bacterium]
MNLLETITLMMCGLGLLALILFLAFNLKHEYSRVYLAFLLFCIIYSSLNASLIQSGLMMNFPHIYRTAIPFIFIIGPALYYYTRTAIDRTTSFNTSFLYHLIPALGAFLSYVPFYMLPADAKIKYLDRLGEGETIFSLSEGLLPIGVIYAAAILSGFIYGVISLHRIAKSKKGRPQLPRRWITAMSLFVLVAFLVFTMAFLEHSFQSFKFFAYFHACISFLLVINLYMRPDILYGISQKIQEPVTNKTPLLPAEKLEEYANRVEHFMKEEKPYLDSSLSLNAMANEIGIPRNQLSWVINQHFEMNFNEFINNYRIDHIINNYSKHQFRQLTMEGIAQEVGFRSRNTFILAVKKRSGKTPTEYFKQN